MHSVETRRRALELLQSGVPRMQVAHQLGVSPQSMSRWQERPHPLIAVACPRCTDRTMNEAAYSYLLGQYLGDGHIAPMRRSIALRIYCTAVYPGIIAEVAAAMADTMGASVNFRRLQGCVQVQSATIHWLCLFPQHGPGRKHHRRIELSDWQRDLVARDPRPLVRGLLHSDGCRAINVVHRQSPTAGVGTREYRYPRYFFSNLSDDIIGILTDALDELGIAWRRNRVNSISIARREAVAALDAFVGPKT